MKLNLWKHKTGLAVLNPLGDQWVPGEKGREEMALLWRSPKPGCAWRQLRSPLLLPHSTSCSHLKTLSVLASSAPCLCTFAHAVPASQVQILRTSLPGYYFSDSAQVLAPLWSYSWLPSRSTPFFSLRPLDRVQAVLLGSARCYVICSLHSSGPLHLLSLLPGTFFCLVSAWLTCSPLRAFSQMPSSQ